MDMRIGELAARAEVNIQTVRFDEREGLLRAPIRTASGYRSYAESDLERLHFVRLCQGLGFTLREIQQLIHLHSNLSKYKGMSIRSTLVNAKRMNPADTSAVAFSKLQPGARASAVVQLEKVSGEHRYSAAV